MYFSSLLNASKPTNNLASFPQGHLASLSNHFVKVLHLHEHILHSSLNIALCTCQWNFSIYFNSHHIFFYNKPTLPKKHCSWELSFTPAYVSITNQLCQRNIACGNSLSHCFLLAHKSFHKVDSSFVHKGFFVLRFCYYYRLG